MGASIAHRNPKAPSSLDMMIEDQGSSPTRSRRNRRRRRRRKRLSSSPPARDPKPQFANQPSNVNDDWVREARAEELREAQAQPLERGDPELAAMNNNPALEGSSRCSRGRARAASPEEAGAEHGGAYADPDARSYVRAPERPRSTRIAIERRSSISSRDCSGQAAPANKDAPPRRASRRCKKKGRPLQGVTLARRRARST